METFGTSDESQAAFGAGHFNCWTSKSSGASSGLPSNIGWSTKVHLPNRLCSALYTWSSKVSSYPLKSLSSCSIPSGPLTHKRRQELDANEDLSLLDTWVQVARENAISDPDSLPYSSILEDLKTRFAVASGVYLKNEDVFRFLLKKRKAGQLPRP